MLGKLEDGQVPSTKEVLLEHLYIAVKTIEPTEAEQITGSYAHLTETELLQLLGNKALLQHKVDESLHSLRKQVAAESKENTLVNRSDAFTDEMAAELFSKVAEQETELCAQVTGMLLELEPHAVQDLIRDPSQLAAAVAACKDRYMEAHPLSMASHNAMTAATVENLADDLFSRVTYHYPQNAGKLTGMLLELGPEKLHHLVASPELQETCIHHCKTALISTGQWIQEEERL